MLGWRYSGFSVHNQVRVAADDAEGRTKLAGYMLRAPPVPPEAWPAHASLPLTYHSVSHIA